MLRSLLASVALLLPALASAAASAPALTTLTYSGDQEALDALDRDLVAAGTDATKLAALESRLLGLLRRADVTFAARQAIAQRLGAVLAQSAPKAGADAYKALAAMLADERDSNLARLALEPAPGPVIDGLFVTALGKTTGLTRLGIIDSIARRRAVGAVSALVPLLKSTDGPTAAAAAGALGEIADPPAVAALHAVSEPSPAAVATAKLAAANRVPPAAALGMLRELEKSARDPAHRAAAFRLSLDIEQGAAPERIASALAGSDWTFKQVALEAIAASSAPTLVATLAAKLASWDAPTQSGAIAALSRRSDAAPARHALVAAAAHADRTVRAAALAALGFLPGTRDIASLLARTAAGTDPDDARVARQSLARLGGPDIDAAVLAGAERGEPGLRVVFLEQIALRNQTAGLPLLLRCRQDPDTSVRLAALGALGDFAPPSEQAALLAWTIAATDEAEQGRALRALVNVTLRNPAAADRGQAVYTAIDQAAPELALRLLPALARLGGEPSAACAARLALRDHEKLSDAATAALARWTDATALSSLALVAEKAPRPAVRQAAAEGALTYLERDRQPWTPAATTVVSRLLAATNDAETRKGLFSLLTRAKDQPALALAEKFASDPALGDDARITVDIIRANLAGPPRLRASINESQIRNILDGKTSTRWSVAAAGEEWVEVDFKVSRPVRKVTLDQTGRPTEFPERYEVHVTDDPQQPGPALKTGAGQRGRTVIELPAGTRGRYLILKNTAERAEIFWTICELQVD